SSHVDRSTFTDDYDLNVKLLIENLKNMIIKKLSVLCMTESSVSFSIFSISFSATLSQSSTSVSVSDSAASATSVSVSDSLTSAISALSDSAVSAFIISSPYFKKILYRLNELYFSVITLSLNSIKNICVFRNRNMNVILFYTHRCETCTPYLRYH
ncbi:hypothetical protein BDBG_16604, partial [Blastomyces gilchristii SLH14081]